MFPLSLHQYKWHIYNTCKSSACLLKNAALLLSVVRLSLRYASVIVVTLYEGQIYLSRLAEYSLTVSKRIILYKQYI